MWDEEFPGQLKIVQALLAKPDRFRSRFTVALATEKASEARKHSRVMAQSRRRALDERPFGDECGQRLPFVLFTEERTRQAGNFTNNVGYVSNTSTHHHVDNQPAINPAPIAYL